MSNTTVPTYSVLIIGDFDKRAESYVHALQGSGYRSVLTNHSAFRDVLSHSSETFAVAIVEPDPSETHSLGFVETISKLSPETQIIVVNRQSSILSNLEARQYKVFWILHQSVDVDEMLYLIARGCVVHELACDNSALRSAIRTMEPRAHFAADTPAMKQLYRRAERIASLDATILITGESGTGKTTLASYIHHSSPRRSGPFISISCATIPRDLIEAELFGHEKGAYTGATTARPGSLELADGGTLFLDEIGELPLDLQPKLLTFLQDRVVRRVGGSKTRKIDVRIICATNKNLKEMISHRAFREDLYYRINVLNLDIPALRERSADIPDIAMNILKSISIKREAGPFILDKNAKVALSSYSWPGNIRELENVLERATAFSESTTITESDLDLHGPSIEQIKKVEGHLPLVGLTLKELERHHIEQTLKECDGDKAAAAKRLGISLKTIYNRINEYSRS